jgi:penicillin-binding protein A
MPDTAYLQRLRHIQAGFLIAFLLTFLAFASWAVWWSPALASREDNPRTVEAELRIQRGAIYDATEQLLAQSVPTASGRQQRIYPAAVGEPVVGYYSLRHGTAGVERTFDELLRGTTPPSWAQFWQQFSHQPQQGQDIRLTLRADWQALADELLAGHKGAVVLLSLNDNAVRVLASQPTYDPNLLDTQFDELVASADSPLLNRATQGLYQPGLILAPFIMAGAANDGLINLNSPAPPAAFAPLTVDGERFTCQDAETLPTTATWAQVLAARCPAALLLLPELGVDGLRLAEYLTQFGLATPPALPLEVAEPAPIGVRNLTRALLGQEGLTVTPLQMALALSVLARDGVYYPPRLLSAVRSAGGEWQGQAGTGEGTAVLAPATADAIRASLTTSNNIIAYESLAPSGPSAEATAWYVALAPAGNPRLALVVVLEGQEDTAVARTIGEKLWASVWE